MARASATPDGGPCPRITTSGGSARSVSISPIGGRGGPERKLVCRQVVTDDQQPLLAESEPAAVGGVSGEWKRLHEERPQRHGRTAAERLVDARRARRDDVVLGGCPLNRLAGGAARHLLSRLLAHHGCRLGESGDAADVIPVPVRDQHGPNRSTELLRPESYGGHFVLGDRRVHDK